jgi:hypothetical protein
MKAIVIVTIILCFVFVLMGCERGDIKISPIIEGQPAPHDGWNIGPELWLKKGDPAKVTGADLWFKGSDPNELFLNK